MKARLKSLFFYLFFILVALSLLCFNVPAGISTLVMILFGILFWIRERAIKEQQYQFITIVTHKFRTPLTGIKWAIQAFKDDVTETEKQDILKQMENSNGKLMEIVDLLIGFVKFDKKLEYAFEAASLHEMIQESLEKFSQRTRAKNIHFTITADKQVPVIIIDRRKIQFVIDMLIDNAVKYTPEGGSIQVSITNTPKLITLSVTDSGIGMSRVALNNVFKKFYRSTEAKSVDSEGMGLGLYTSQTIMHHHGGRLRASSEGKDKGSTFFIDLPIK